MSTARRVNISVMTTDRAQLKSSSKTLGHNSFQIPIPPDSSGNTPRFAQLRRRRFHVPNDPHFLPQPVAVPGALRSFSTGLPMSNRPAVAPETGLPFARHFHCRETASSGPTTGVHSDR